MLWYCYYLKTYLVNVDRVDPDKKNVSDKQYLDISLKESVKYWFAVKSKKNLIKIMSGDIHCKDFFPYLHIFATIQFFFQFHFINTVLISSVVLRTLLNIYCELFWGRDSSIDRPLWFTWPCIIIWPFYKCSCWWHYIVVDTIIVFKYWHRFVNNLLSKCLHLSVMIVSGFPRIYQLLKIAHITICSSCLFGTANESIFGLFQSHISSPPIKWPY